MKIKIRDFTQEDIINKINWVNDSENNEFLHYDLPLVYDNTLNWFNNKGSNRYDGVIEFDEVPVGLIGLLSIDNKAHKAEIYILIGNRDYKNKGIAYNSIKLLLEKGFNDFELNKVYLYTETSNIAAQKLFKKVGFKKEGLHKDDIMNKYNVLVDRYSYGILKEDFFENE